MSTLAFYILNGTAIVATAVVFGTDVFFALIAKKALAKSKDTSVGDIMGRLHEVADVRMPIIGFTAIISTLLQVIVAGFHSVQGQLALLSLSALLTHLVIYLAFAKPVNNILVEAVKSGRLADNARDLQRRWDRVINLRAALLLIAIICLIMIKIANPD